VAISSSLHPVSLILPFIALSRVDELIAVTLANKEPQAFRYVSFFIGTQTRGEII
jgi:hypothetical protein